MFSGRRTGIRRIVTRPQTIVAEHSTMSDAFVPNWDRAPGPAQHLDRVIERDRMGQKMTPPGEVKLKPRGR